MFLRGDQKDKIESPIGRISYIQVKKKQRSEVLMLLPQTPYAYSGSGSQLSKYGLLKLQKPNSTNKELISHLVIMNVRNRGSFARDGDKLENPHILYTPTQGRDEVLGSPYKLCGDSGPSQGGEGEGEGRSIYMWTLSYLESKTNKGPGRREVSDQTIKYLLQLCRSTT